MMRTGAATLIALLALLGVACGAATAPGQVPVSPAPRPLPPTSIPRPTASAPAATAVPTPPVAIPRPGEPANITPQQLKALLDGPTRPAVFDSRLKASYDAGHIPGALSLPLGEMDRRLAEVPRDRLAVFYCSGVT